MKSINIILLALLVLSIALPLNIIDRTPQGEFGICTSNGFYANMNGAYQYSELKNNIKNEIASRLARGML